MLSLHPQASESRFDLLDAADLPLLILPPHRRLKGSRQLLARRSLPIAFDVPDPDSGDAEQPDLVTISKSVSQLGSARRDMERLFLSSAPHYDSHRHARIEPHDLLDIFETLDRASVDAKDHIARLDAALFCRTSRLHLTDFGRSKGLANSYLPFSSVAGC